jgi:hypothetical protein
VNQAQTGREFRMNHSARLVGASATNRKIPAPQINSAPAIMPPLV